MGGLGRWLIGCALLGAALTAGTPAAQGKYRPCTWGADAQVATDAAPTARAHPMRWGCRGPVFNARAVRRGRAWLVVSADRRHLDVQPGG